MPAGHRLSDNKNLRRSTSKNGLELKTILCQTATQPSSYFSPSVSFFSTLRWPSSGGLANFDLELTS